MRELLELMHRAGIPYGPRSFETFSLDDGSGRLRTWFEVVTLHRHEDSLMVTETMPVFDYVLSMTSQSATDAWPRFVKLVESEIAYNGSIRITKDVGVFEALKAEATSR